MAAGRTPNASAWLKLTTPRTRSTTAGPPELAAYWLRRQGRCPWPLGGNLTVTYCGREIVVHGDKPNLWCLEHECEAWGDEDGAIQERNERTLMLLGEA